MSAWVGGLGAKRHHAVVARIRLGPLAILRSARHRIDRSGCGQRGGRKTVVGQGTHHGTVAIGDAMRAKRCAGILLVRYRRLRAADQANERPQMHA